MERMSKILHTFLKFSHSIISGVFLGIPIYITLNDYVFCVARVEGTSMQPTLNPGTKKKSDIILLDKWHVKKGDMKYGDIVAIISPTDPDVSFIKRIIGLEGDMVPTPRYRHHFAYIPKGHCWIEGDNHRSSLDSNSFGPISIGLIKGKATHIVWPPSRWQRLDDTVPMNRLPVGFHNPMKSNTKTENIKNRLLMDEDVGENTFGDLRISSDEQDD